MRLIFCLILVFGYLNVNSQSISISKIIDSLKLEMKQASDIQSKFSSAIEVAVRYTYANPDSTIKYGKVALTLAKQIGDINDEIWALAVIGEANIYKANLPTAMELALTAIERSAESTLEDKFLGPTYYNLSAIYYEIQDYDKALFYAQKMLEISETQTSDGLAGAFGYYLVANVYERLGQPDSVLKNLERSLPLFEKYSGSAIASAWQDRVWPGFYNLRAKAYLQQGNYSAALRDLFRVLETTEQNYEYFHSANTYSDIALYYRELGMSDSTVYYAQKGLSEANNINYTQGQMASSTILAEEYEKSDPVKSLYYFKLSEEFKNKLYGAGNIQILRDMIEKDGQRREDLAAAEEAYRNRLRTNAFLGSTFTLIVIAVFLYRNNRSKQKAKQKIELAYDQLKSTQAQLIQSEKMASLGELTAGIAHEIQNPLNFVNNFSEVNNELIEELEAERLKLKAERDEDLETEILSDIKENERKIHHHGQRASSIVKGMLEHSRTSDGKKELTDINALADEYLRLAFHGLRAKDNTFNAEFKTDFDETLPKIKVIPQDISRVLLNLINNAFYAVDKKAARHLDPEYSKGVEPGAADSNESYKPEVIVSTRQFDGKIEIRVKDNGPGIPEEIKDKIFQPFFTTKPSGSGTGLGLSLSYDIVKAHGGEIIVESTIGEGLPAGRAGSEFIIQMPIS